MASASALVPVPALGYVGARSSIVAIFLSAITDIPAPSYNTQGRPISPVIPHLALGWKIPGPTLRWPSARPCGFQRLMVEALAVPDASRHKPTEIEDSPEPEEWSVLAARQGKTKGREREDATRMVREEPGSRIMREPNGRKRSRRETYPSWKSEPIIRLRRESTLPRCAGIIRRHLYATTHARLEMSHHPKLNHDDSESPALLPMMSTSSPNQPCPPMPSASALVPVPVLVYVRGRSSTVSTSHWPLQTSSPPLATPRAGRLPQSSPI
ncbi:hypothetical protein RhiJN_13147 [Ceratobasidium sp. AG-Ba]|nr:hypothetical protein RhiJN_13147 [Ceratobasidium sp. AG-Ba]